MMTQEIKELRELVKGCTDKDAVEKIERYFKEEVLWSIEKEEWKRMTTEEKVNFTHKLLEV